MLGEGYYGTNYYRSQFVDEVCDGLTSCSLAPYNTYCSALSWCTKQLGHYTIDYSCRSLGAMNARALIFLSYIHRTVK